MLADEERNGNTAYYRMTNDRQSNPYTATYILIIENDLDR